MLKAIQQAEADPLNPAAAIELHKVMIGFQAPRGRLRWPRSCADDFPENFEVQMHLGYWHTLTDRWKNPGSALPRPWRLSPRIPGQNAWRPWGASTRAIWIGQAICCGGWMCPVRTPARSAIRALADAYQGRGDHGKALAIYKTLAGNDAGACPKQAIAQTDQGLGKGLGETKTVAAQAEEELSASCMRSWGWPRRQSSACWVGTFTRPVIRRFTLSIN